MAWLAERTSLPDTKTFGELEAMEELSQQQRLKPVRISRSPPTGDQEQGAFSPQGTHRKVPHCVASLINEEARDLACADIDLRSPGHGFHVYNNRAFEGDEPPSSWQSSSPTKHDRLSARQVGLSSTPGTPSTPGTRRQAFATDYPVVAVREGTPMAGSISPTRAQSPAITVFNRVKRLSHASGTEVQTFSGSDDDCATSCSAPRSAYTSLNSTPAGSTMIPHWEETILSMISTGQRAEAVERACPSTGRVQCYVKRCSKGIFGGPSTFTLHLEQDGTFLLAARKRKKSRASTYVISTTEEDLQNEGPNHVGKLKANFVGTEYTTFSRSNPFNPEAPHHGYGMEDVNINYKAGLTVTGPRQLIVAVPIPDSGWRPQAETAESLSKCTEAAEHKDLLPSLARKVCFLSNRPPEYDERVKAHTLDFYGRVKEGSVKNFQLVHWDHATGRRGADVVLQFGKAGPDKFILDFMYPLTIKSAFAIALAALDTKLCYAI